MGLANQNLAIVRIQNKDIDIIRRIQSKADAPPVETMADARDLGVPLGVPLDARDLGVPLGAPTDGA